MAEIFLSYASEDRRRAKPLAEALAPMAPSLSIPQMESPTYLGRLGGSQYAPDSTANPYSRQQYDFSENALLGIAQRAMTAKNPDDAIAYLQTNLEYYPKSARTYQAMAQARTAKGDKQAAIKDLEKAVELDPQNTQARNQLQQLKGQ
jgi:tetratricopeptide (TPR) repeat protein